MTANSPVVDPLKVQAPAMLVRGEYDGIATEEDLIGFFQELSNRGPAVRDNRSLRPFVRYPQTLSTAFQEYCVS